MLSVTPSKTRYWWKRLPHGLNRPAPAPFSAHPLLRGHPATPRYKHESPLDTHFESTVLDAGDNDVIRELEAPKAENLKYSRVEYLFNSIVVIL